MSFCSGNNPERQDLESFVDGVYAESCFSYWAHCISCHHWFFTESVHSSHIVHCYCLLSFHILSILLCYKGIFAFVFEDFFDLLECLAWVGPLGYLLFLLFFQAARPSLYLFRLFLFRKDALQHWKTSFWFRLRPCYCFGRLAFKERMSQNLVQS